MTKIFGQFEFRWLTVAVSSKLAGRPCQGHLCNLTSHPHQQNIIKIEILSQYYKISIKILSLLSGSSPDSSSAHQHYLYIKSSHIFWFVLIISTWISCPSHTHCSRHNGTIMVVARVMVLTRVLFCPPRLLFSKYLSTKTKFYKSSSRPSPSSSLAVDSISKLLTKSNACVMGWD